MDPRVCSNPPQPAANGGTNLPRRGGWEATRETGSPCPWFRALCYFGGAARLPWVGARDYARSLRRTPTSGRSGRVRQTEAKCGVAVTTGSGPKRHAEGEVGPKGEEREVETRPRRSPRGDEGRCPESYRATPHRPPLGRKERRLPRPGP